MILWVWLLRKCKKIKESLEFLIFYARLVGEENEKHMFRVLHVLPKIIIIIITISLFLFFKKKRKEG